MERLISEVGNSPFFQGVSIHLLKLHSAFQGFQLRDLISGILRQFMGCGYRRNTHSCYHPHFWNARGAFVVSKPGHKGRTNLKVHSSYIKLTGKHDLHNYDLYFTNRNRRQASKAEPYLASLGTRGAVSLLNAKDNTNVAFYTSSLSKSFIEDEV